MSHLRGLAASHSCQHVGSLSRLLQGSSLSGRPLQPFSSRLPQRRCIRSFQPLAMARRGLAEIFSIKNADEDRPRVMKGKVSPEREVPAHIKRPPYAANYDNPPWTNQIEVHTEEGVQRMRESCKLAAQVLQMAGKMVKPGVTTEEIDTAVHQMIIENNAYPSPLRYGKFPKSVCTSINEVVCHGIPDSRPLRDGDIVNIDVTVYLNGYHGDTSSMFYCGEVDEKAKQVCEVTKKALDEAIKLCKPGAPFKQIGAVCQEVAQQNKLTVVKQFCGHGVGKVFHASPMVMHTRNNEKAKMQLWQTFTIEPILCNGNPKGRMWPDAWTYVTNDGCLSAQYEHTILITPEGAEVLTMA